MKKGAIPAVLLATSLLAAGCGEEKKPQHKPTPQEQAAAQAIQKQKENTAHRIGLLASRTSTRIVSKTVSQLFHHPPKDTMRTPQNNIFADPFDAVVIYSRKRTGQDQKTMTANILRLNGFDKPSRHTTSIDMRLKYVAGDPRSPKSIEIRNEEMSYKTDEHGKVMKDKHGESQPVSNGSFMRIIKAVDNNSQDPLHPDWTVSESYMAGYGNTPGDAKPKPAHTFEQARTTLNHALELTRRVLPGNAGLELLK